MPKFRKRPIEIEAVQWDGNMTTITPLMVKSKCEHVVGQDFIEPDLIIETPEGEMRAKLGDWIILGINGELYPCKPDIFAETYDPVEGRIADELEKLRGIASLAEEYFVGYMQDEASEPEICVDDEQHRLALALRDALRR